MFAAEDETWQEVYDAVITDDDDEIVKESQAKIDIDVDQKLTKKKKKRIRYKAKKLVINLKETKYQILRYVAKEVFNFRLSNFNHIANEPLDEKNEWDILWTDNGVTVDRLYKMKPY